MTTGPFRTVGVEYDTRGDLVIHVTDRDEDPEVTRVAAAAAAREARVTSILGAPGSPEQDADA